MTHSVLVITMWKQQQQAFPKPTGLSKGEGQRRGKEGAKKHLLLLLLLMTVKSKSVNTTWGVERVNADLSFIAKHMNTERTVKDVL